MKFKKKLDSQNLKDLKIKPLSKKEGLLLKGGTLGGGGAVVTIVDIG